jgi:glycosyltransferase involved in cell wall biosynthesis
MNILYIDHYAGGPSYGMEFRPFLLSREWSAAGHRVTIVAASESHLRSQKPAMRGHYTEEWIDGIRHVWCLTPPYSGNSIARVINIFAFLARISATHRWLRESPDVVIASSTYPLDIYPARRIARKHGARLIWEVHDLWPLSPIELGRISKWHPFMLLLQKAEDDACRCADAIVSILPKADEHLKTRGMNVKKYVHIPNGVDPGEWEPKNIVSMPEPICERLRAERAQGRFLVGYTGAHGTANALYTLIEAAAKTNDPNVRFVLLGSGSEKARLQTLAAAGGRDNVLFFDPVAKAAIPCFLKYMDVAYIGLKREPLFRFGVSPNKLIDYMMSERPVICAVAAGNDLVSEAGCGFTIAPEDPDAVNEAVARFRSIGPAERECLGKAGHQYVLANYAYPILARRFLATMGDR